MLALPSLDSMRAYVKATLCARDRLDESQSTLKQAAVVRRGKPCGLMFQVCGPRLLRTYAVWAALDHRILFYDSTGRRFEEVKLTDSPGVAELLPRERRLAA